MNPKGISEEESNLCKKSFIEFGNACNQLLTYSWKVI